MSKKENVNEVKDRQSRKYNITLNNPLEMKPRMTHEQIKEEVAKLGSVVYWCMADERGAMEQTPHTHIYLYSLSPIRFSTIKRRFPQGHIESAYGTSEENRNYILKEGKWKKTKKMETSIPGTFQEYGEIPSKEKMGAKGELQFIYEMIESGFNTAEILRSFPQAMRYLEKIDRTRQLLIEDEYKNTWRDLTVIYMFGETATGKTRAVMEKHGYANVFRVTDYNHPFDGYKNNEVIVFEEFRSSLKIQDMLNYLDGYPCELMARYNNKTACYLKVYIISNIPLEQQYLNIQRESLATWQAFLRRITQVVHYKGNGQIVTYPTVENYLERDTKFHAISEMEQCSLPFSE